MNQSHNEHANEARKAFIKADTKHYPLQAAIYHATMAVYEALVMPSYGMSVGEQVEQLREHGQGPWGG